MLDIREKINKINLIRFNNTQLSATPSPTVHFNRFSLLAGTLLNEKDVAQRCASEHCAASQQFSVFNSEWQTSVARRRMRRRAMTTSKPFGGVLMVRVGKRCLHTYPTYPDLLNCPPSINR